MHRRKKKRNRKRKLILSRLYFRALWKRITKRVSLLWPKNKRVFKTAGKHIAIVGGFTFIVLLIHHELISVVEDQENFAIDPNGEDVAVHPSWADNAGTGSVAMDVSSTLDDDVVTKIGRAFEKNPWIKEVTSVERIFPDQIRVRYKFREPEVAVWTSQGYILVDEEGVRLPGRYPEIPVALAAPSLHGIQGVPPAAGRVWNETMLDVGREMATLCLNQPILRALEIERVTVIDRSGKVVLHTPEGCAIQWGRSPGRSDSKELSVRSKIDLLRRVLHQIPRLQGLESVVLFGGRPVIHWNDASSARHR